MAGGREELVRICDLAGRPRGTGFAADEDGTVVTSHEAIDGLARIVLHAGGGRTCVVDADAVVSFPETDLALVRTEGLGLRALPLSVREHVEPGAYVRIAALGWREARVLDAEAQVTYTATDRFHLLGGVLELAVGTDAADALQLGGGAAGGPVVDTATGAVLGVLGTALDAGHRAAGYAVPLRAAARADASGVLGELLTRNAASVPAYGRDLNLAGALQLSAISVGSDLPREEREPVQRVEVTTEFEAFLESAQCVLGLVGDPGSGRTTELGALARRRARGGAPAPTVWLRGAGLQAGDASVADAVGRVLAHAGRIVAASEGVPVADEEDGELGDIGPDRIARLVRDAGRPLLVLLDGPEEMPPQLAHRLAEWSAGSGEWLRQTGTRLVVACRPEYWEQAGALFPGSALYGSTQGGRLPACVRLGEPAGRQAGWVRALHGVPDGALAAADAAHPLAVRLLGEVRDALGEAVDGCPDRAEIFSAYLDLLCLRIAVRLAALQDVRGPAVRRLAAKVSGRLHEAARRCLGPGQGELDREAFEEVFPWATGWASAVLTEGALVPAGGGYRFAHEELADWIQGAHLDLDAALFALVHRWRAEPEERASVPARLPARTDGPRRRPRKAAAGPGPVHPLPVPRHRIGPVLQALLLLERQQGPDQLRRRLDELTLAADHFAEHGLRTTPSWAAGTRRNPADAAWWAVHLLTETLLRVPDARPYMPVLRLLADRILTRGPVRGVYDGFGPWFWRALPLPAQERLELLRRLVVADTEGGERCLDTVAALLKAEPALVQPLLTQWFGDDRPLAAAPAATVADAAQALLHTHRHRALDDLTEALVDCGHPRGDELLATLAEEEPSALCRAVDRWAHDDRAARRVAAAAYGLSAALHVDTEADRTLLRYAALALLARPEDGALHGAALSLLVRDPVTRARHLPLALKRYASGDPQLSSAALATALTTHPEPVLGAFRSRLREPGAGSAEVLEALAGVTTPAVARRVTHLVRDFLELRPEAAVQAGVYVDRRLEQGAQARATLFPLVTDLLQNGPPEVRRALAGVLAAPGRGGPSSRVLRGELLDVLLELEHDPAVLDEVLTVAVRTGGVDWSRTRDLVRRCGLLLVRTPEGAASYDRRLVSLAHACPDFARALACWLEESAGVWTVLVGPSARRMIVEGVGVRVSA
ncbi:serine protease [Streptomyces sp. TRM66268-LWL]|uniref:Serine protease n=1 Tax=Streptomyces polyasparticus TaxID=2767826 RepID=A0ABR7S9S6_9ACTN|nr:S1C family serine protease [Streptomyces polyasparticus]MBC9711749.1 serine protease [Streptomyces polyasparticus]